MADLTTQAGCETYRDELYTQLQEQSDAAGKWSIEGASYDRAAALKATRSLITWIELRIAGFVGASKEPVRMGIDTDDLSDD
jgi:hypothetical protein